MPFGNYGGSSESAVARMELSMPQDMDAKLRSVNRAVQDISTSMKSVNRFTDTFMNYVSKLPEVADKAIKVHQNAIDQITQQSKDAQDKVVSRSTSFSIPQTSSSAPEAPRPSQSHPGTPVIPDVERPAPVKPDIPQTESASQRQPHVQVDQTAPHVNAAPTPPPGTQADQNQPNTAIQADQASVAGSKQTIINAQNVTIQATKPDVKSQSMTLNATGNTNVGGAGGFSSTVPQNLSQAMNAPFVNNAPQHTMKHGLQTAVGAGLVELAEVEKRRNSPDEQRARQAGKPTVGTGPVAEGEALPSTASASGGGTKIIGHLPVPPEPETGTGGDGKGGNGSGGGEGPRYTAPLSRKLQSQLDYRNKLQGQIGDDPLELLDRLRQRGHVTEGMDHGQASWSVRIGNKNMSAQDFMKDKSAHQDALDQLAEESSPESKENGPWHQRIPHAVGKIHDIMGAVTPGASPGDTLGKAGEFIGSLGKSGGMLEGAGGAMGALGAAAGPVGAVLSAVPAAQEIGEQYQSLKNEGSIKGGGAGEGAQIEMETQMMALNPFISTEQSRQVIMAGLNSGYARGKPMESVTDFMSTNLKEMNMSVAQSTELLNKNVKEGGVGMKDLGMQLENLKNGAATGAKSLPQLIADFTKLSGQLIDAGASGESSGKMATQAGNIYNQTDPKTGAPDPLSGKMTDILGQMDNSAGYQGRLVKDFAPGSDPTTVVGDLADKGELNHDKMVEIGQDIGRALQMGPQKAPATLVRILASHQVTINATEAKHLIEKFKQAGGDPNKFADDAVGPADKKTTGDIANVTTGNTGSSASLIDLSPSGIANDIAHPLNTLANIGNSLVHPIDTIGSVFSTIGSGVSEFAGEITGNQDAVDSAQANIAARTGYYSNPALDNVTKKFGLSNTIVYDEQGKPHEVDYNDKAQMEGLQSGKWKIATASSQEQKDKLKSDWQGEAKELGSSAQTLTDFAQSSHDPSATGGEGGGTIELGPEASKYFTLNRDKNGETPKDPNTTDSNAGYGGSTRNNPSPGNSSFEPGK